MIDDVLRHQTDYVKANVVAIEVQTAYEHYPRTSPLKVFKAVVKNES